jgi:hypothetical protein
MKTPALVTGIVLIVAAVTLPSGEVTAQWGGRWRGIEAERGRWGAPSQGYGSGPSYPPGGYGAPEGTPRPEATRRLEATHRPEAIRRLEGTRRPRRPDIQPLDTLRRATSPRRLRNPTPIPEPAASDD